MENKNLINKFHEELTNGYAEYVDWLEKYNDFVTAHNKKLDAREEGYTIDAKEFNTILLNVQSKFNSIYQYINYINQNGQFARNVLTDYTSMMDSFEKNGLTKSEKNIDELLQSVN